MVELDKIPAEEVRGTGAHRRSTEQIVELSKYLPRAERDLIDYVYAQGLPVARYARIAGERPGVIQRKLEKILQRIDDPLFQFVVCFGELIPRSFQRAALMIAVHGLSQRRAAEKQNISLHQVRNQMIAVHALANRARSVG